MNNYLIRCYLEKVKEFDLYQMVPGLFENPR